MVLTGEKKRGLAFIKKTKNNMFVCLKDDKGNLLFKSSGGAIMKGRGRTSKLAGEELGLVLIEKIKLYSFSSVFLTVTGPIKYNIEGLVSSLRKSNTMFDEIVWKDKYPHNGVRKRKQRRK